ncbi:MAG: TIR domain-containing protein, partial [Clostridia bacterium]|nr:TIR domain-containing protein [Clostridia bacterium]
MNRIINKHDVFISWTGADRELKNTVADFLRNNGISCLESDHSCSGDFRQWSREAVSRCNIFLLIGSVNIFNSQWVPVEIEEFKKLDNFKNRIVPIWVSDEARLKERWGLSEYASGVILDENGLTEDALNAVLDKVKLLLIDFLDREYKEASKSEYIKLISLSRKSKSIDRDFDFSKLYIKRTLHETDDKGAQLNEYPGTDFLYESDSVCFICGPAGCGKSQYINQIREDSPADVIIIRLPCSKASSAADVFSEAYKEFSRVCGNRFFYSENDFASLLNSRRVVLIFDGMDEIATTENKRRLIEKAEEFGKANKGNVTL